MQLQRLVLLLTSVRIPLSLDNLVRGELKLILVRLGNNQVDGLLAFEFGVIQAALLQGRFSLSSLVLAKSTTDFRMDSFCSGLSRSRIGFHLW